MHNNKNEQTPEKFRTEPFLMLNLGGLHLTVENPPHKLLAFLIAAATGIGTAWGMLGR